MSIADLKEAVATWIEGLGLSGIVLSAIAALVATLALLILIRIKKIVFRRLQATLERWQTSRIRPFKYQDQELLSAEEIVHLLKAMLTVFSVLLTALLLLTYLTIVIAIFPITQPIAAAVVSYAGAAIGATGFAFIEYLPNLLQIGIILIVVHFLMRFAKVIFNGIASERIKLRRFYPEWADPTGKIVKVLLIAPAAVVIIPLLPGASSPAFKGVSIFLGALVSLGSTGVVSNIVAGTVSTYMRAFQAGDRVRIADTEGTVIKRTTFVTKIMTPKNVVISVPNAMVMSNHIINYSELAKNPGLILHTAVTIGYDVPWRQVHELLISAAMATEKVEADPEPFVLQTSLDDHYVSYELNAYTNSPNRMAGTYSRLHQNIQDAFNEAGVEIMSPHYSALRDGNRMAVPDDHLPKNYQTPAIRVHPLERILPGPDRQ